MTHSSGVAGRSLTRIRLVACAFSAVAALSASATPEPAEILRGVATTVLDHTRTVSLRDVRIEFGPGNLEIDRGILVPAGTPEGRVVELIFIGQARFLLDAPDEIEAGQLELFTGLRSLDAPVEEAVLVLVDDQVVERLLGRPSPREMRAELTERIVELHSAWVSGTERRRAGVEAALFRALIGDPAYAGYFALWADSYELGDFIFHFDPEDVEPITLASFEALDLTGWERARLRHHIRVEQRKGRWLDLRVEDLGAWDIWASMALAPSSAVDRPGGPGFEAEHYELDVTIARRANRLEGVARIDLRSEAAGRRIVRMELLADLEVESVVDDRGRELFHFRSGDELLVLLPEPSEQDGRLSLEVRYAGRALDWVVGKYHDLRNTSGWYPHCGAVDRATYDVTLHWPAKLDLLAAGRRVDGGHDRGERWERRKLDVPAMAFTFVVGKFDVERRQVGDVEVTLAFNRHASAEIPQVLRTRTLNTVAEALLYFEDVYGAYPLDHLTLVTVPRTFSQSFLGFVTLAESIVQQADPLGGRATWMRDTTVAHEIAHQWWGNLVGWWSYRDQWLSEGMAHYSALMFDSHRHGGGGERLATMSAGWRESLSQTTLEGRTIESLGPIVLGNRLNSSRARNAYATIVYRKGAVVLAMLARAVGEERFLEMLHSLVDAASHRVLTTDAFLKSLERMSGLDLDGFARQYVYGTGIPEVYYGYDTKPDASGGWRVAGEARLLYAPRYRHSIAQDEEGRWDVLRDVGQDYRLGPSTLMVPYRIQLEDDPSSGRAEQFGQLTLDGQLDAFEIATMRRPIDLKLDPRGEILAWFYDADHEPKRVLRYQGEDLAAVGRYDEAEARYRDALGLDASPSGKVDPLNADDSGPRVDPQTENLRIKLSLTRVMIEQGRIEDAERILDEAETEVDARDEMLLKVEREALRSRIDLSRGDYSGAQRRLRKTLRLAAPPDNHESWRRILWQWRLNSERVAMTEAFSLLALASYETRDAADLMWALREARDRGADVTALATAADEWLPVSRPRGPHANRDTLDLLPSIQ